jgi:flavoprotein
MPRGCKAGAPRSHIPDAILVAPATYNTINKWAEGISDTYALGIPAEAIGLEVPIVVLPFVNTALAGRAPFRRSVESCAPKAYGSCWAQAASSRTRPAPAAT